MPNATSPFTHDDRPKETALENVHIYVRAEPHPGNARNGIAYANRVVERLKNDLLATLEAAAPNGLRAQFVAVQEGIKNACAQIDPGAIVAVKVMVSATHEDAKHYREYHASPTTRD
jgi:hypothetical protein